MNLLVNGTRRAALAATLGVLALLASCGGGDPVVAFVPTRVLAFGDENSVLTSEGRKFTINSLTTDANNAKSLDCSTQGIWTQRLAASYGLVFPECNPLAISDPRSRIFAAPGAKVADLVDQVDQHLGTDTFSSTDLVTLFVGQNDVFDQYAQYPGVPKDQLLASVYASGQLLALQVTRIATAGGKVLVSTVPDLGFTPFALNENLNTGDVSRAALLSELVAKFNEGLRVGIAKESGSKVAIMLTDELVQAMAKFPATYANMIDVTEPACDITQAPTVDQCTTDTLVTGTAGAATVTNYLWADDKHLSPNGHAYVGALAASRSRANPF